MTKTRRFNFGRLSGGLWKGGGIRRVFRIAIAAIGLCVLAGPAQATTYFYVSWTTGSDDTGDGSAGNPWKSIAMGLYGASAGTEANPAVIRVAGGTYVENPTMKKGWTTVQGGYDPATWARDLAVYPTIVNGGGFRSVFALEPGLDGMKLDGLKIVNGKDANGGGVYMQSNLALVDCEISDCEATSSGGGIYVHYIPDGIAVTLTKCRVEGNTAATGGGINAYYGGPCTLTNCTVNGNTGGGIHGPSDGSCTLENCTVTGNTGSYGGVSCGGNATLTNCTVTGNTGDYSGGISCHSGTCTLTDCTITGNAATGAYPYGGGLSIGTSNPASASLIRCVVAANKTEGSGGGILVRSAYWGVSLTDCIVSGNIAGGSGGGIFSYEPSCTLTRCTLNGNTAGSDGGAVAQYGTLDQCIVFVNSAAGLGGGLSGSISATNCLVWDNTGGGINLANGTIKHCTIANNPENPAHNSFALRVYGNGATIANTILAGHQYGICEKDSASDPAVLKNNLFYNNTAANYLDEGTVPLNSAFQINNLLGAANNKANQDPLFYDAPAGDLHIQNGSPCIDAATGEDDLSNGSDLDGNARPYGSAPDIGAYEWGYPLPPHWPTNPTPAEGATGVDTPTSLLWQAAARATSYDAYLWKSDAAKPDAPTSPSLTGTSCGPFSLEPLTEYCWQVVAKNAVGETEGEIWTFESAAVNRPPQPPTNVSPANGATGVSLTPALQSSAFSDPDAGDTHAASQWQARESASPADYSVTVFDSGETATDLVSILLPAGRLVYQTSYAWRVRHRDNRAAWSGWSTETQFTTMAKPNSPPTKPSNTSPVPGATGVSLTPTLQSSAFSDPDTGDTHGSSRWEVRESASPADYSVMVFDSGATGSDLVSIPVPAGRLAYETSYAWRVRHRDNRGAWSNWSSETLFTTMAEPNAPPGKPANLSPANGATGVSLSPTLESSAFSDPNVGDTHGASQWQARESASPGDYSATVFDSGPTTTSLVSIDIVPGHLLNDTTYWWHVRHWDNHGAASEWSDETQFTTVPGATRPAPPQGLEARGGADCISLNWTANTEPDLRGYKVYGRLSSAVEWTLLAPAPIANTNFTHDGLTLGETWEYYVTAVNYGGAESDPSATVSAVVGAIRAWTPDVHGQTGTQIAIPVNISYATGISDRSGDVEMRFPADLLQFNHVDQTVLTEGWAIAANVRDTNLVDLIVVATDPEHAFTMTGEGRIVEIVFDVIGTEAGATGQISFDLVRLYDADGHRLNVDYSDTSVFTVAPDYIRGDLNGDQEVDSMDVAIAMDIAVGRRVPTQIQLYAGDINGDGEIDSADVALIMDIAVGRPINPTEAETAAARARLARGASETAPEPREYIVAVGSAQGGRLGRIAVAVTLNDATNFSGCDLTINFDAANLTLEGVEKGGLVKDVEGWQMDYQAAGNSIDIDLAGPILPSGSGELVVLHFVIGGGAAGFYPLPVAQMKLAGRYGEDLAWENWVDSTNGLVKVLMLGPPSLDQVQDGGGGVAQLEWSNAYPAPFQFLGFVWDVYQADWVKRFWEGTLWCPFLPAAISGEMDLGFSGAYHAWISSQYPDASWYPCQNPWTGILWSGTPHTPVEAWIEDLGSRHVRLHWKPDVYGTWCYESVVYRAGQGFIAVEGPSSALGFDPWTFVDYGGAAYDAAKASFLEGRADIVLPADGDYWFFMRGCGWLSLWQTGGYAVPSVHIGP